MLQRLIDCVIIPIPSYKHDAVAAGLNIQERKLQKLKSCRENCWDINLNEDEIIQKSTRPEVRLLSEGQGLHSQT